MIIQFSDIALISIDEVIQIIDSIQDNTMFGQRQGLITTAVHNVIHAIFDYYERLDKTFLQQEEANGIPSAFMVTVHYIKMRGILLGNEYDLLLKLTTQGEEEF